MLRPTKDLQDLAIVASDSATERAIGDVTDLCFDDAAWAIRDLVVDTGAWLSSRKVLVSPIAADKPDRAHKLLPVSLTREQIRNSPDIDTEMPVTRQHGTDCRDDYSYPYHWHGMGLWGGGGYPTMPIPGAAGHGAAAASHAEADSAQAQTAARQRDQDPHLRSCKAVVGYHIEASDGEIGHVQGLLVDEESRAIRSRVVNTSHWWLGHQVLVAPQWIKRLNWAEQTVAVDLTHDALQQAPHDDPAVPLSRDMEIAMDKHHGCAGHWPADAPASDKSAANPDKA